MDQKQSIRKRGIAHIICSLLATAFCLGTFCMKEFVYIKVLYYEVSDNFVEFCGRYGDLSYCHSLGEKLAAIVVSLVPMLVIGMSMALVAGLFVPLYKIRRILVTSSIIATLIMFFFAIGESGNLSFKSAFYVLLIGLALSVVTCLLDKPVSHSIMVLDKGNVEWRCPKCDMRNPINIKFCKRCSTSRPQIKGIK